MWYLNCSSTQSLLLLLLLLQVLLLRLLQLWPAVAIVGMAAHANAALSPNTCLIAPDAAVTVAAAGTVAAVL